MRQMTREEAIQFGKSDIWQGWTDLQIVRLQLFQDRICIPTCVFFPALRHVLQRVVWTHECASSNIEALRAEYLGDKPAPTWEEIIAIIPPEKRIVVGGES